MVEMAPGDGVHRGARLRDLRGRRSLKEFGDLVGLSPNGVRKLEQRRDANPKLETLLRIQRAMKFASIEEVFGTFPSERLVRGLPERPEGES